MRAPTSPNKEAPSPAFVDRHPQLAGAAGALAIAFSAVFVGLADVSPTTAATFRCAYALPPLALLTWWRRRRGGAGLAPRARRFAALAGLAFCADLVLWHNAIGLVGAGLATVLANLQVVVVALVGWLLLGERPPRRVVAVLPVVLGGVVLISGVAGDGAYGDDPLLGSALGALTAVAYSGFFLLLRAGNADPGSPAEPLLWATATGAAASALVGAALGELSLVPTWPAHGWLLLLALASQVLGWLLISVSLPRLPAVVTALLLLLQPAGSVLLGVALLGERPSPSQWLGVLLVLAGVTGANLHRRRSATRHDVPLRPDRPGPR